MLFRKLVFNYITNFSSNASCNTLEKFILLATALSFNHNGIVKVFFTDLEYLDKSISQVTRLVNSLLFVFIDKILIGLLGIISLSIILSQ